MVKISIIVPCYNTKLYIEQCLNSLINQTLKEIEIILFLSHKTEDYSNHYTVCMLYDIG